MSFGPPVPSAGPLHSPIYFLAEAPGSEESDRGIPLVGPSGRELARMCSVVGIDLRKCRKGNVFNVQPSDNNIALFGGGSKDTRRGPLSLNPITHLHPEWEAMVNASLGEIADCDPNVVVALGNTASWSLGLGLGIKNLRGNVYTVDLPGAGRPIKVLPTYHPASVLRQWDQRVVVIADLAKALVESRSPTPDFANTTLWLNPSLSDIAEFDSLHMAGSPLCAVDIETARGQITCIAFAPSTDHCLCIPFRTKAPPYNYWPDPEAERIAWSYVRAWMEDPALPKLFQNGLYDLQYLVRHCSPRAVDHDTMLAHHSLLPELPKSLGFLGSTYCNTPAWKSMRTATRDAAAEFKKDE